MNDVKLCSPRAADMSAIERWVIRAQFSVSARTRMYELLGVQIDNNVQMLQALRDMYAAASDDGSNPKSTRAIILQDLIESLSGGSSFAAALGHWVGSEEAAVISAGENAGQLRKAFKDAQQLIAYTQRIAASVWMLLLYPGALGLAVIAVLYVISAVVVPKLQGVADPETWENFAAILYRMSQLVLGYGNYAAIALVCGVVLTAWSLKNYTGSMRRILDKLPPWSIARHISGATFMLNLAVMVKSGVKLHDALLILEAHASPWLKQRVAGAISGTRAGLNIGEALAATGHEFPDRESIRYVRTLANHDGFDRGLYDFAKTSLDHTISAVERISKVLLYAAIASIAMLVLMIVGAISDIQSAIDAGINR